MAVKATSLVTLAQVLAELDLVSDGGVQDFRLEGYIDRVTDVVEGYCRRKFSRASVVDEAHAGFYGPYLVLDRPPINSANPAAMTFKYLSDGDAVATTDMMFHDAQAGIVHDRNGWTQRAMWRNNIAGDVAAGTEEKTWFVTYDGGFVTAVQSATTGGTYDGVTVTMPGGVEQAVLDTIKLWNDTQLATPGVVEQKIGDASERTTGAVDGGKTDQRSLPPSVRALLDEYRLPAIHT
jgi:hypothetical protein